MKKMIFVAVAILAGTVAFAQQKKSKQPPPPPPKVEHGKFVAPPPPPPKPKTPPPPKVEMEQYPSPADADYQAFLKQNPTVKGIGWADKKKVRIHLKSGKEEVYDMNNEEDVERLKNKYGELPAPPPPPPPPPPAPKMTTGKNQS